MGLTLEITQKQIVSQNMIQSMEILQMNTQELEAYIENLALENPVIELPDISSAKQDFQQEDIQRKMDWLESTDLQNKVYYQQERNSDNMEQNWHDKREMEGDLKEYLMAQLLVENYSVKERAIVEFLIESLDGRGYLTDEIDEIAEFFSVSDETILKLLKYIQNLDPAGVGARDLKECLLLQLERKEETSDAAAAIVQNFLPEMGKNHLDHIAKKLQLPMEEVLGACEEIRALNPKPGNSFSNREQLKYISPDAIVVKFENEFEILVNEYQYPHFTINAYYRDLMKTTSDAETKKYLQTKLLQAEWVQNCVAGRTSTLSRVLHVLVEKQNDFFMYGVNFKRPLKLSDIAKVLEIHESTVSRALKGKYLQCAWGIFPLNYFLVAPAVKRSMSHISDDTEEKTAEQVKQLIQQIIEEEDKHKPLSDQKISDRLKEQGTNISRRTVNKYRTEMGISDKSGRKIFCG